MGVIDGYNLRRRQEKKQKTSARGLNPGQGFNSPIQEENRNRDDSDIFTGESKCLQQMFRSMILANKEIEPDIEQSLCYPSMTSDGKDQKHPPNRIASISLSETGVRFGRREALPPTAVFWGGAGTLEPESV